jgi:Helix-turn-helix domain
MHSTASSKPPSRPFKKFYCDDKEVFKLPGIPFKIWMYHYAREGKERKSWPTVETICEALDINPKTLNRWRKYLIANGWLQKVGDRRREDGEYSVPIFKVRRGTVPHNLGDGRKRNRAPKNGVPTDTNNWGATDTNNWNVDRYQNLGDEVDSGLLDSEEVESGVLESKSKSSHSLPEPSPKPAGKRKRLEDFPAFHGRPMETREEREEYRAILLEMAAQGAN